ncbi:hypothetical protein [Aquimarina muelleri]|uniref:Uncharacterized protein n=1 Tax=Aquimarina muelleri TaxID=279356 RepID=A0A918JYJ5_9FLAO|nr:hypothetical protein [Aquimarina muelleri]MCX2764079.1 hypothetical protein [Aquimarina muelleri]GGX28092.1 hypothetical protein GCM10007384_31680 [Aquimarina muelleri]
MKALKIITTTILIAGYTFGYAQTEEKKGQENSSEETITKIIRIKGANGEEKVIKKQEVITTKSEIKLNPEDEGKTDQSAIYTDKEVIIKESLDSTEMGSYTKIPDEKGFVITFFNKTNNQIAKVRPLSNEYYIVNFGDDNNCIGHFDENNSFIIEKYDSKIDQVTVTIYKIK